MDALPLHNRYARRVGSITLAGIAICLLADGAAAQKASAPNAVTFCQHIAPILFENCAACHRPGEIGPFSLLSYESARKRADSLAEITADRRMPPWKPDTSVGHFRNERRLTNEQIELIAKWAADGAPEGDPEDLPEPPKFVEGWQLGEPDLVVKMAEPFSIPAGGRDIYRCFSIPIPIEKDMMVSAVEFRPGNSRVVRRAIMFLDANHAARELCGKDGQPGYDSFGGPSIVPTGGLGGWTPGAMRQPLPDGIAHYVRNGSDLVLHIHYHPTDKPQTDQSTVGIHFSKKPVRRIVSGIAIAQTDLEIPAGRRHFHVRAESEPLPVDVFVLGVTPHMHNLGRQIKVTAVGPGGKGTAPLIWIKDWDFNWLSAYQFVRPLRLPKGSTIQVRAYYDNSKHNPKNPTNPPDTVSWGEGVDDEMCLVSVQVITATLDDLRKIAQMPAYELAAGIEGGIPGASTKPEAVAKKSNGEESTAEKPVAKRPAATEPAKVAANRPVDGKPKAKKPGSKSLKFPAGGIPIPEGARQLLRKWDPDGNGLLSRQEFDALPEGARDSIVKRLLRTQSKGDN